MNNRKMREKTLSESTKTCTTFYERDNFFFALFSALEVNETGDEL